MTPTSTATSTKGTLLAVVLLLVAWAAYAVFIVKDFSGPLIAAGDANYFEYLGYHLEHHYRFGVPPTIDFHASGLGYPEGTNIVFLSWCVERDLLAAFLRAHWGAGPWLQLYCAASPGVGALGTFFLLRREVGVTRAGLVAFAGSFMAFYAAFKFPIHLNMSVLHWATLSIVVDYLVARHVVRGERLPARLVLARVALLPLLLGLDLGYVAGYALTSFTVTTVFCVAWLALRWRGPVIDLLPNRPIAECREHPWSFAVWVALGLVGVLIYLPTALVIVAATRAFRFPDAGGNFWASQLRLLIPFTPVLHPDSPLVRALFGEADGVAEFSTGWALIAAAFLGLRDAKRRKDLAPYAPVILTFLLCFAFHPKSFPTLQLFPWFLYNRVAGRSTIFFPLFFALMALGLRRFGDETTGATPMWTRLRARPALVAIFGVGLVETVTAYTLVHAYAPSRVTPDFTRYMQAVRDAPGLAIFDFPFCIAGANGVGTAELCPYYRRLSTSYSYRRFHDKGVLGFYLSRLHPTQITSREDDGWPALFSPDDPDPHAATRETRCWGDAEWGTFRRILRSGRFGAMQLYTDFLPPECLDTFHARFGGPVAQTKLPGVGPVELLLLP